MRYKLPYSDAAAWMKYKNKKELPMATDGFSHTLDTQIGGQIAAGFVITVFTKTEDNRKRWTSWGNIRAYIVTRAVMREYTGFRLLPIVQLTLTASSTETWLFARNFSLSSEIATSSLS